jgi:hypothetical protein
VRRALFTSSASSAGVVLLAAFASIAFADPRTSIAESQSSAVPTGGDGSEGFVLQGFGTYDESGFSVRDAGDVNGDGVGDIVIGAPYATRRGYRFTGESYVVFGRTTGFPAFFDLHGLMPGQGGDGSAGFVLRGIIAYDNTGFSTSSAGDVNGDGLDDLVIGAPDAGLLSGNTYVVFGRTTGFPPVFDLLSLADGDGSDGFVLNGVDNYDWAGTSVSDAGDVNGDGIDDLVIGARLAGTSDRLQAGESYVVFGRTTGFPAVFELSGLLPNEGGDGSTGFIIEGIADGDMSGRSVSNAGDVNGDGIDDVIIGAFHTGSHGRTAAGESYVVFGRATAFPAILDLRSLLPGEGGDGGAGFVLRGIDANDSSGYSVSTARDVKGDRLHSHVRGARRD